MSLWDNIRKRRAAGKRKLKPGDKNYPKTLNIEAAQAKVRWRRAGPNGEIEATIGRKKYKIEKALDHNERHKGEWKVYVWDRGDWQWETTEHGKANAKDWIMDRMNESTDWVCGKCNCEPCTCGEVNESMKLHPEVVKAYKKTLDAEDKHGEYGTVATKRAVTRTANTLSKKINQHHPNLDMNGKIKLRTQLQNMKEEAPAGANVASIPNPADTAMGPRFKAKTVTDRRRKKEMVLLKRFRKHMEENG